jgi:hypothetical protein
MTQTVAHTHTHTHTHGNTHTETQTHTEAHTHADTEAGGSLAALPGLEPRPEKQKACVTATARLVP